MMKQLLLLLLSFSALFGEFEVTGSVGLDSQVYLTAPEDKHKSNFLAFQELEFKYEEDALSVLVKLYAQEDSYDLSSKEEDINERTFVRLDEFYLNYDFENDSIQAGKSIKMWGALEVRNIVDVFNPIDFRTDMFEPQKLGVYNASYSHFTESGEISVILKLDEQDQEMSAYPYVYYFLPKFVNYNCELNEETDNYRPSIYLTYSGSTDTEYALDFAFIYENGYDSQRYFLPDSKLDGSPVNFNQYSYTVNKFMTYNTLVVDTTLLKLEALYAKVDDNKYIGDYSHIALGFEHTLENFLDTSSALGLIGEYYKYTTYDDDKYGDLKLFETMQNDVFLGLRYSFNNPNDTSILGGVIADMEYDEETYYVQFDSRFYDSFRLIGDYHYVNPSKNINTAYALLGKHQRIGLNLAWHF